MLLMLSSVMSSTKGYSTLHTVYSRVHADRAHCMEYGYYMLFEHLLQLISQGNESLHVNCEQHYKVFCNDHWYANITWAMNGSYVTLNI